MPESPIRKLAPLAVAAKKRGTKVYHLNIGQPDLPTPQVGLDALKTIDREILEYSPSQGYQSYREKLVDYYAKYNINVTADDIIITSGGSEAVLFAFMSCLNPSDEIIVPEPAYANYMAFAISAGAKIRTIATTIDEGFSLPKVEKFEELINSSYTTTTWTTQNGVYGRKITSKKNGNSIFLPAAGYRHISSLNYDGSYGDYWSRSLHSDYPGSAWRLLFYSSYIGTSNDYGRSSGRSVRPVCSPE